MKGRRAGPGTVPLAPAGSLPGYANVSEIATGTFSTVYQATELGTGRQVALKVLRLADTSPHLAEVFDKELGALALLSNHPNVTTLYRTFISPEGRPVLVLELCRESLAQRVRQRGPMTPADVIQVGVKISGALATAHRAGLLHRDIKPQNMLVSEFGEPVLADFGVAALQAAAQSTEGVFGFTTLHAPPEALEGMPLSPAADIYGLASSMYQLALGRGPFAAYDGEAPASVILRILRDPAPRPPATAVPIALSDLLAQALAKDPASRPQTADEFAEALRAIEIDAGRPPTPFVVWGPGGPAKVVPSPAGGPARAGTPVAVALPVPSSSSAAGVKWGWLDGTAAPEERDSPWRGLRQLPDMDAEAQGGQVDEGWPAYAGQPSSSADPPPGPPTAVAGQSQSLPLLAERRVVLPETSGRHVIAPEAALSAPGPAFAPTPARPLAPALPADLASPSTSPPLGRPTPASPPLGRPTPAPAPLAGDAAWTRRGRYPAARDPHGQAPGPPAPLPGLSAPTRSAPGSLAGARSAAHRRPHRHRLLLIGLLAGAIAICSAAAVAVLLVV
ncbi:MAG TPA: protein kinase [Acidimicrobiales bacterium]|nr:protein kinase [Acidimicrobiales bacterium]